MTMRPANTLQHASLEEFEAVIEALASYQRFVAWKTGLPPQSSISELPDERVRHTFMRIRDARRVLSEMRDTLKATEERRRGEQVADTMLVEALARRRG